MKMYAISKDVGLALQEKNLSPLFPKLIRKAVFTIAILELILLIVPLKAMSITLDECIKAALNKNPSASAALLRVSAAQAMIEQTKAAYYPQLSLSGSYSLTDNPTQAFMFTLNQRQLNITDPTFNPNEPDDTDNIRISVGLKYRIYDAGNRKIRTTMAKLGKEAATEQLSAIQNELIYQVTQGYYSVLQAQDFVEVQKETIKSLEENLRVAKERFGAGSAVKTDVLNLEVKLAQAREDLIRTQNGTQLAIAALNTAIGEDLISPQELPIPEKEEKITPPNEPDFSLVENRPELQAANKRTLMKKQEYQKAMREYYPIVRAFGSYDWDSDELDEFEGSYTVGLVAEWEFFSGFKIPNAIKQVKSEWQASQRDEKNIRNNLRLDLQRAQIQSVEAWQRLEVARKSIESAQESLRITRVRYKEGAADITELLTAQVGLTVSQTRNVAAYYDYLIAISNVKRALGELVREFTSGL